uniref:Uncharacterized protein n=1 Tax=Tanacetum cinerariifolium TaxID=118510 RepID=A0A699GK61_TANCI|nr:hypothetical protein [Tanacetum cinerariifolium]
MEGVTTMISITTVEEKDQRRLEVKAISTLMMGILNEHQLMFNSIKDAKQLLEAVEKRFGGNATTKKTQINLLKQQYKNFTASSLEMPDQTFDRLQKFVSQLKCLGEKLSQEDVNQKLLRSLSHEWNTHAVMWRNEADLDTMSMDDLYNNLKVYEPKVKRIYSLSLSSQNMAFVSSSNNNSSSTNGTINTAYGVSTASTQVNDAFLTKIDNLKQIHPDDMEEMDLRWKIAMLTMRAIRFLERTGRKLTVNGNETISFDKSNVSDQAEEGPNYALMAFLSLNSDSKIVDNCKKGLGYKNYNAVPPPYIGNFMPLTPDLSFTGLDEFANKPVAENTKSSKEETKAFRKNNDALIIKEWVLDDEEENVSQPKIKKKIASPSIVKKEFVKPRQHENTARKTLKKVKHDRPKAVVNAVKGDNLNVVKALACWVWKPKHKVLDHVSKHNSALITLNKFNYIDAQGRSNLMKEIYCLVVTDDHSRFTWVFFLAAKDETGGILKSFITRIENLVDHKVKMIRCDNRTEFKNREMNQFCEMKGKFNGKADEGLFVGYSLNSKAFRVFNSRTKIVKENLHIRFNENTLKVVGSIPDWLFDIDELTRTMNYEPIVTATQSNSFADPKSSHDDGSKPLSDDEKKVDEDLRKEYECNDQEKKDNINSSNNVNVVGINEDNELPFDPNMSDLEDVSIFNFSNDDDDDGIVADMNNLGTTIQVSPILTTRIHKDHPLDQVIGDLHSATQTRRMTQNLEEHGFVSTIQQRTNHKNLQNACLLAFYHMKNPKRKKAIGTKWVFRNKKDKRGIVIRNKARLVAQGHTQEEGIDYDKVFALIARIEAIRLFLDYASFKDFMVYQMDVKSDFLYGKIKEEVYVCEPSGFEDPDFPDRVYKIEKALSKKSSTPIETYKPLRKDEDGEKVNVHMYRSMISSLMYLASSRPDIMFAVCACARYQVNPKVSHLHAVKMIFRFVQVFLEKQLDGMSNHERKYISPSHTKKIFRNIRRVGKGFSGRVTHLFPTMVVQYELGEGLTIPTDLYHTSTILQSSSSQPQKTHKPREPTRKITQVAQHSDPIEHVADEAVHKELEDRLVRAATTVSSLDPEQDSGNTLQSDEDRLKLNELMDICANLQTRILDLEKIKTTQSNEIASLKRRVKKLKKKNRSRNHKLKRLYKVGLTTRVESLDDEEILEMFDVNDLGGEEVFVAEQEVEQEEPGKSTTTTTTTTISKQQSHDKGKRIMVEEPMKPKKKDKIRLDEEAAKRLQAEFDEEERLAKEKA